MNFWKCEISHNRKTEKARFEVLTAVLINIQGIWVVTQC